YQRPLEIAGAVIRNQTVRLDELGQQVRMASLVIDLDRVFEDYVREVLVNGLEPNDWQVLNGNHLGVGFGGKLLFDSEPSEEANPDVVIRAKGSNRIAAI